VFWAVVFGALGFVVPFVWILLTSLKTETELIHSPITYLPEAATLNNYAVAFTTQCPYCIELHANKAREIGASDPEIAEAVLVAAALRAGGAITHGTHAMKGG
jgi:AhpD family alkylhydroperoxidase